MQAAVIHRFGGPSVLSVEQVSDPVDRPGSVTVQLIASSLNWHDVLVRRGRYESPLPHIPGSDGVGIRRDTGEAVIILPSLHWGTSQSAPGPGWEILGDKTSGTHAELVSVPNDSLFPRPPGYADAEAAAFGLVGVTVFRALMRRGRLRRKEWILVLGAGGGVASVAVSMASALGANAVVTSSSPSKIDSARARGAVDGVIHSEDDWVESARALTPEGRGFDVVLDSVGRWQESISALRPGGRCVVLGSSSAQTASLDIAPFYFGQFELIGTTMGSPGDMRELLDFTTTYRLAPPVVDTVFSLEEISTAHERLESGMVYGKIVLSCT